MTGLPRDAKLWGGTPVAQWLERWPIDLADRV